MLRTKSRPRGVTRRPSATISSSPSETGPSGAPSASSSAAKYSSQCDAERSRSCRPVDVEVAHQLGDDEAAQPVVVAQRVAALDREAPGVDRLVVAAASDLWFCAKAPATSPIAETPTATLSGAGRVV